MEKHDVLKALAPCGLDCSRCVRFKDGDLARAAQTLFEGLIGFSGMASRMAQAVPALAGYPQFEAVLKVLAEADCIGCRRGSATCLPTCQIKSCFREKGVDFCGECVEFPCDKSPFPGPFKQRWMEMNQRIKENGPEAYYTEQRKKPRYGG
jgi:hypothetical protein